MNNGVDNMGKVYTEEFLISEFFRFKNEHGRYPYMKELTKTKGYPSEMGYKRIWGSWDSFLKDINIVEKDNEDGWYACDENILMQKYYDGDKDDIINSLMIKRTWDTIKKKASKMGLNRDMDKVNYAKRRMSNDFLLNEIKRFVKEFNHTPTHDEFSKAKGYPSTKAYKREFGTWNNAIREAGFDLNTEFNISKEEILKRARDFYNEKGKSPYWNELGFSRTVYEKHWSRFPDMLLDAGLPLNKKTREDHYKTDDELIHDYKQLHKILGRIPVANDVNFADNMASFSTYKLRFGGYKEIWKLCGITNNEIIDDSAKYGFICLDRNGDICKSYAEMVITNLFIDNNVDYIKEYSYRNLIDNPTGRAYVLDWYLPQYQLAVEYFGLYRESHKNKKDKIGDYTRKAMVKMVIAKENNIKLLDLYQEDLNETYLQRLVEKFKKCGVDIAVTSKNSYKNNRVSSEVI